VTPPEGAERRPGIGVWLGLFAAVTLTMGVGTPPIPVVATLFACAATLAISLRWRAGVLAVMVLLGAGILLRTGAVYGGFSDVLTVTRAAMDVMLSGENPYGRGYPQSTPPGAPFAYGPLALVWYLPALGWIGRYETYLACGLVVALAVRGRVLGLAVYAVLAPLLVTASDGSNDTSAGLLLLVALLVAQRVPLAGAALLAVAAAFKPYAAAWLPPLLAYGGVAGPLIGFVAGTALIWGPAVLRWGGGPIVESFRAADAVHATPYYSLAWILGGTRIMPEPAWQLLRLAVGAVVAIAGWPLVRTARSFVLVGAVVYVATLYTGWWSTFAYLAALAPVLCWHLDDWLGLGEDRVRWPGDPVGRLTGWVDARWPILRPWPAARGSSTALAGSRGAVVRKDSTVSRGTERSRSSMADPGVRR
jgi:hypothetical protein